LELNGLKRSTSEIEQGCRQTGPKWTHTGTCSSFSNAEHLSFCLGTYDFNETVCVVDSGDDMANSAYLSFITSVMVNQDCLDSVRKFYCYYAYPKCNAEGTSLALCNSVCENMSRACEEDLCEGLHNVALFIPGEGPAEHCTGDSNLLRGLIGISYKFSFVNIFLLGK